MRCAVFLTALASPCATAFAQVPVCVARTVAVTRTELHAGERAVALAAQRDGAGWMVAMRLRTDARRGATDRVVVLRTDGADAWGAPTELASWRTRATGGIVLAVHEGAGTVAWSTPRGIDGSSTDASGVRQLARNDAHPVHPPLVRSDGAAVWIVRRRTGSVRFELLARPGVPGTAVTLPGNSLVTDAVAMHDGSWMTVAQTPGRRYVIANVSASGTLAWTGNGPAGCDQGRCPAVTLVAARDGAVATWRDAPTRDGLAVCGARVLDARGHSHGRAHTFVPMADPVPIATADAWPLALQLGRPVVVRGASRPFALGSTNARTVLAATALRDGTLHVFAMDESGGITHATIDCTAAGMR